jgi:hypothetical protein
VIAHAEALAPKAGRPFIYQDRVVEEKDVLARANRGSRRCHPGLGVRLLDGGGSEHGVERLDAPDEVRVAVATEPSWWRAQ